MYQNCIRTTNAKITFSNLVCLAPYFVKKNKKKNHLMLKILVDFIFKLDYMKVKGPLAIKVVFLFIILNNGIHFSTTRIYYSLKIVGITAE